MSKCGLLVNQRFGLRIALGGVVTTTSLTPTEKISDEPCPPECSECVKNCPVNAISTIGKVNHSLCMRHSMASPPLDQVLRDPSTKERYSLDVAYNLTGVDDHGYYTCFECIKACPLNDV